MRALSASLWGVVVLIALMDAGLAQQSVIARPEVIGITGIGAVLPRQAGSKDAPDVSVAKPNVFDLQSASSGAWISESGGTANTAGGGRKNSAPSR